MRHCQRLLDMRGFLLLQFFVVVVVPPGLLVAIGVPLIFVVFYFVLMVLRGVAVCRPVLFAGVLLARVRKGISRTSWGASWVCGRGTFMVVIA